MPIFKKTWKEKRIKKAESPLNWSEQKSRALRQKKDTLKDKEIKQHLKLKKRLYLSEQKKKREQKESKNQK